MTRDRCPSCGKEVIIEEHVERCEASVFTGTDTCPMCGEPFDSYLAHLARCRAGVGDDPRG
jgi:ribosomal protein S27AE